MALGHIERILILAKTYPSPSSQYLETSCVAGITDQGAMRRLYPIPFRMIEQDQQFKKWQWIEVRVEKSNKDHRPESHKVFVDTISCQNVISTKNDWADRWTWLNKCPIYGSIDELEKARFRNDISLGIVKPTKIVDLIIEKARTEDWTEEEKDKLMREQMQGALFSEVTARLQIRTLRKVHFDFYYRYFGSNEGVQKEYRHKIVDWEVGALYWNCKRTCGHKWEEPFRAKLVEQLLERDMMFLMGNIHRFQDQWLVISLLYPPIRTSLDDHQSSLF